MDKKKKIINDNNSFVLQYIFNKNLFKNILNVASKNFKFFYCIIKNINFINNYIYYNIICDAKIRHSYVNDKCILKSLSNNTFIVKFLDFKDCLTLGQSIVFYKNSLCLGGGIIISVENKFIF